MPRSVSADIHRRLLPSIAPLCKAPHNTSLEDASSSHSTSSSTHSSTAKLLHPVSPREYDSCPCGDSFFLLPDSVLGMDADTFRKDLSVLDPVLSASLPDWGLLSGRNSYRTKSFRNSRVKSRVSGSRGSLLHNHEGLTVTTAGRGTVLIGGGSGDGGHVNGGSGSNNNGADRGSTHHTSRKDDNHHTSQRDDSSPRSPPVEPSTNTQTTGTTKQLPDAGPNELFFGTERSSSGSYRDREERLRILREKQQQERQQKLDELKQHAAAAQRFREQQEAQRRQRLQELRSKDQDRRQQVEERRRYMEQAEREKRDQVLKKTHERDQRMETKRRNERSNIVFAFGSSTPRMLDPKENSTYWGSRRSTSTSNVTMDGSSASRRSSDCVDNTGGAVFASTQGGGEALARKRATSAQGLDRNSGEMRMSSSMYEVFHWTDGDGMLTPNSVTSPMTPTQQGTAPCHREPREHSPTLSLPAPTPTASKYTPFGGENGAGGLQHSLSLSSSPIKHKSPPFPSSSSGSGKKNKFSVWEFDDNFVALGRHAAQHSSSTNTPTIRQTMSGRSTPYFSTKNYPIAANTSNQRNRFATSWSRQQGSYAPRYLARKTSLKKGDDLMSRSMTTSVARRRTDIHPITPSLRDGSKSGNQRSPGGKSVGATPSGSRPTSALSHASSTTTGGGVTMRPRSAVSRRPRPMSIAGTAPTSSESRARSPHRNKTFNMSAGSSTSSLRSTNRAKSATSDGSAPATPARTPSTGQRTPKRTPAQVKADSARKSAEKSKPTPSQSAPKKTGNKTAVKDKGEVKPSETLSATDVSDTNVDATKVVTDVAKETDTVQNVESVTTTETVTDNVEVVNETEVVTTTVETVTEQLVNDSTVIVEKTEETKVEVKSEEQKDSSVTENGDGKIQESVESVEVKIEDSKPLVTEDKPKAPVTDEKPKPSEIPAEDSQDSSDKDKKESSTNKPVTGYTSEEEYKAVLAEKRRLAREAKEREAEMERIRLEEEAERERQEEAEMLKLIEEQRKAEEVRLQKAIEAAQKEKELEKKRLEEEEKERIEAERIEAEKQKEAEEKLRKEEEERMKRKDRVAAIMARTRKAGSTTPNKSDSNTPNEETKSISEALQKANLTDSMIDTMSDSMIAAATTEQTTHSEMSLTSETVTSETESVQATSGVSSAAPSDFSSQPPSDVSTTHASLTSECSSLDQQTVMQEDIISVTSPESVTNGNVLSDFNGHRSNGAVHNTNGVENSQSANLLGSFDPFTPSTQTTTTTTEFEQIIDAGSAKVKLANEDAINSNDTTPPPPIVAFQENDNIVTDLLL